MASASPLPTRFPCWVRAVYSWGGENKHDLGFVEGDLIECLNAGDGSWWTGRLRRDKRMVGTFPSNFVKVLDASFEPKSRGVSPMPIRNGSGGMAAASTPKKAKTFRKPFQAYSRAVSPNPAAAARELEMKTRESSPSQANGSVRSTHRPTHRPSFSTGHVPSTNGSFRSNHRPTHRPSFSNDQVPYGSRAPSPAPPIRQYSRSRGPSPDQYQDYGSSPPPPAPPPHRVTYNPSAVQSPNPDEYPNGLSVSRGPSPIPPSPAPSGHTPSPLRNAMEDVMSSLQGMGISQDSPSAGRPRTSMDPWSPEAFDEVYHNASVHRHRRPRTSLGIGADVEDDETMDGEYNSYDSYEEEPPQFTKYTERMESHLRSQQRGPGPQDELFLPDETVDDPSDIPPAPPPKSLSYQPRPHTSLNSRPHSSLSRDRPGNGSVDSQGSQRRRLKNRKSAYELGREMLGRTFTIKSNATSSSSGVQSTATNSSNSTQLTSQSIMSGQSAGAFSATSAGSLARRRGLTDVSQARPTSVMELRSRNRPDTADGGRSVFERPALASKGITFHEGSRSGASSSQADWAGSVAEPGGVFGGLVAPKAKKSGFFKKIIESAKTGAASARTSIAPGQSMGPPLPQKSRLPNGVMSGPSSSAAREMGLGGGGGEWVQVRRDVNRSNSLSKNERVERVERCQMMDYPVINPVDALFESTDGDEGIDGLPVSDPTNFLAVNFAMVDKNARFINSLPAMTNPTSLAQGHVCRPYRSDAQRLRAIFTWVSEKIAWEEDFEGDIDARRVIQAKRGCAKEVAVLVMEMCTAVGLHAEVVQGYLKTPGEMLELDSAERPNHWWNAVLVDGEWRVMDCSLASPTNPKRSLYSSANSQTAEFWWFLARPTEICYSHIPLIPEQQHICPPIAPDSLLALPCACPPFFKNGLQMVDYDTSLLRIEQLELVHLQFYVAPDVECVAEVEAMSFKQDTDADLFESGDVIKKRALAQAEWVGGQKRYTVKALLPGDEGHGILKVYAGKRGLMHSIKDNPHPLAFAVPITHTGENPAYDFLIRHPTPHAQRHDLYVVQPQCARLAVNNTFVFAVRQHPSSLPGITSPNPGATSPRPTSAMSMASTSTSSVPTTSSFANSRPTFSTHYSSSNSGVSHHPSSSVPATTSTKPAKLAIQAPSGKILRLMRKSDHTASMTGPGGGEMADGGVWETIIKIGEKGVWRGLVLADRSARWCVWGEWYKDDSKLRRVPDLDSLTSSLLYAYIRTYAPSSASSSSSPSSAPHTRSSETRESKLYIPLLNVPSHHSITLRPEFLALLPRADLDADLLLTLDDLPPREHIAAALPPARTRWVLVDHNVMTGWLGQVYGGRVVGIVDHHVDERKNEVKGEEIEVEPTIITPAGSCSSLVTNFLRPEWDLLSSTSASTATTCSSSPSPPDNNINSAIDAHLATLALASILIDTTNLTATQKVTPHDSAAVSYLLSKIHSSPTLHHHRRQQEDDQQRTSSAPPEFNSTALFEAIDSAKHDISNLHLAEILEKDYKGWKESGAKLGISSVVRPLDFLRDKAAVEEEKPSSLGSARTEQQEGQPDERRQTPVEMEKYLKGPLGSFAASRDLDLYAIMTAASVPCPEEEENSNDTGTTTNTTTSQTASPNPSRGEDKPTSSATTAKPTTFQREILLLARTPPGQSAVERFVTQYSAAAELGLVDYDNDQNNDRNKGKNRSGSERERGSGSRGRDNRGDKDGGAGGGGDGAEEITSSSPHGTRAYIYTYKQLNTSASRKQVAPMLREAMADSPAQELKGQRGGDM
ncbi:MAG: hypothetical protein M1819_002942 [Sarea resinae]|nr:MAG: hypothetical protein M1819_002942 [Sarea resinae]